MDEENLRRALIEGALKQLDAALQTLSEELPDDVKHTPLAVPVKVRQSGTFALLLHAGFATKAVAEEHLKGGDE